jgi:hypothetical protein
LTGRAFTEERMFPRRIFRVVAHAYLTGVEIGIKDDRQSALFACG